MLTYVCVSWIFFIIVTVVVFTTYWKSQCCCIHCLFGVNECWWLAYTHTIPFIPKWYYLMIPIIPNMYHLQLTLCMNYQTKTGNNVSKFTHSNCITPSIIQVLNTRVWFLNIWYISLTLLHSNLEHGLANLTESFSPLKSELHNLRWWIVNRKSSSIDTIPSQNLDASIIRSNCKWFLIKHHVKVRLLWLCGSCLMRLAA